MTLRHPEQAAKPSSPPRSGRRTNRPACADNRSMELMRTDRLDLMQVHNLLDWRLHLKTMRRLKDAGRIRYVGVNHYTSSAYTELEAVLRAEPLDFVQLNYSLMDRAAGTAAAAACALTARRGARQSAARKRIGAALRRVAPASRRGRRAQMHQLGAVAVKVRHRPSGGDLRHPGHLAPRAHGGECRSRIGRFRICATRTHRRAYDA